MADKTKVNLLMDKLAQVFQELKTALNDEPATPVVAQSAPTAQPELNNFDRLRQALETDRWPEAVNKNLVCDPNSEIDKMERGRGIVELLVEDNLSGLKFLDYGCGEGYSAFYASEKNPTISVGYDIKEQNWKHFQSKPNLLLTNDRKAVAGNGPYDVILMFDVIDHLDGATPVEILADAASLLSPTGKIYMRTHPYTSRHATHLYHNLNKAFVHLVFTEDELKQIVPDTKHVEKNLGVTTPILSYGKWIEEAKLTVVHRREIKDKVENFFKIPQIAERIMKNTKMTSFPEFQLSIQFIDFILKKS
jgi:2-polyprenyl-3-methyl-5-hydroxy-6-metoxy-1,4-benzoquinol methylase